MRGGCRELSSTIVNLIENVGLLSSMKRFKSSGDVATHDRSGNTASVFSYAQVLRGVPSDSCPTRRIHIGRRKIGKG